MTLELHEIRKRLEDLRTLAHENVLELYTKLENRGITLDEWDAQMAGLITDYSYASFMLGYDSEEVPEHFLDKLNKRVTEQLGFFEQFVGAIGMGLAGVAMLPMTGGKLSDHLKWNAWRGRALSYLGSFTAPFWMGVQASYSPGGQPPDPVLPWEDSDIRQSLPLPAIPGDGSTLCGQWCRCEWDIKTLDEDAGDYDCYWIVDEEAEHCQTCIERAGRWSPLKIRNWDIVARDVVMVTKEEEKSLIKAIVMRKLKEKVAQKGGKGSGNWGHQGLEGVWGGSSPTKTATGRLPSMTGWKWAEESMSEIGLFSNRGQEQWLLDKHYLERYYGKPKSPVIADEAYGAGSRFVVTPDRKFIYPDKSAVEKATHTMMYAYMAVSGFEDGFDKDYIDKVNKNLFNFEHQLIEVPFLEKGYLSVGLIREPGSSGKVNIQIKTVAGQNQGEIARSVKFIVDELRHSNSLERWSEVTIVWLKPEHRFGGKDTKYVHIPIDEVDLLKSFIVREDNITPVFKEVAEKGGQGSGNWGHQGLAGVWGGSSPTKSGIQLDVGGGLESMDEKRFPDIGNMPLMKAEPSEALKDKSNKIEFDSDPSHGRIYLDNCEEEHVRQLGVVQAVDDLIKEKTGFSAVEDARKVNFADSPAEMMLGKLLVGSKGEDSFGPEHSRWNLICRAGEDDMCLENGSAIAGYISSDDVLDLTIREFGEDHVVFFGGVGRIPGYTMRAEHLIAHELGHILYYGKMRNTTVKRKFGEDEGGKALSYETTPLQIWDNHWEDSQMFDRHTDYSIQNAAEGFAETFVSYVFNVAPSANLENLPESFQLIEELFRVMKEGDFTEKGGQGSGNWGHQGLAGVWGGSSPTKSPAVMNINNIRTVWSILDIKEGTRGRKKEITDAVKAGLSQINKVHKCEGDGSKVPVEVINSSVGANARIALSQSTKKALRIEVNQKNTDMSVENPTDFLHEMGHFFTLASNGVAKDVSTPLAKQAMDNLLKTIQNTNSVKKLEDMKRNPRQYKPYKASDGDTMWIGSYLSHVRYLLESRELLARSYAQYITYKAGTTLGQKALEKMASFNREHGAHFRESQTSHGLMISMRIPSQWTKTDFKPSIKAGDDY